MSELRLEDRGWFIKEIIKAEVEGEACFINDYEPCDAELTKFLESKGYTVERLPTCDIIHFIKQGVTQ